MVQYDWTDISKLDYHNQDMRNEMLKSMHWWMDSIGIDGFRCDVAGEVPTDFWNWAMADLRLTHPDMFTLAEDEDKAQELTESAFDMYYGWSLHHMMNNVAQGKSSVEDLWANLIKTDTLIRPEAIRMNFITNHDENSWNGTEFERMGDAVKLFAALCYVLPGMPMIYTGQLSGNHHRLEFFEKDLIDSDEEHSLACLYKQLNGLRERNKALFSPEAGAPLVRIATDNEAIFACVRQKEGRWHNNTVVAVMNMSDKPQSVTLDLAGYEGKYYCICGKKIKLEPVQELELEPWQYMILEK
jgi:1,4-alpha-glucan branching enzyme